MEIVIENPASDQSGGSITGSATSTTSAGPTTGTTSPAAPIFGTARPYRTAYIASDLQLMQNVDYYHALTSTGMVAAAAAAAAAAATARVRDPSPEPIIYEANLPIETSLKRVDRSGLLGIVDHDSQLPPIGRSRQQTRTGETGTLPRRVDRSGLLEAVPELPDSCQNWKHEGNGTEEAKIVEADLLQRPSQPISRGQTSPRGSAIKRLSMEIPRDENSGKSWDKFQRVSSPGESTTSPYLRRYPSDRSTSSLERPTPVIVGNDHREASSARLSPNKFLPIDALPSRSARQSFVDLTGSTYARSGTAARAKIETTSKFCGSDVSPPDCLGRLSPRSRNERQSPLTMTSSIPDVIEAHGSRSRNREATESPERSERAEAEGCEQPADLDDDQRSAANDNNKLTFKGAKKILHNDNIQTLRVIILSEQL